MMTMNENGIKEEAMLGPVIEQGSRLLRKTEQVSQLDDIERIKSAIKNTRILEGTFASISPGEEKAVISLFWKTLRVEIDGDDFFHYSDLKDMESSSATERVTRQVQMASRYSDSVGDRVIGFVPVDISRDDEGYPVVKGSRRKRMEIKRDLYFFSPKPLAEIGSRSMASIVTRNPNFIRVEAFGCETVMGRGSLSAFEYIGDLEDNDRFSVGSRLEVAITGLETDRGTDTVRLKLSHRAVELAKGKVEKVSRDMIGQRFSANVIRTSGDHYILMLNGYRKRALVHKNGYKSEGTLHNGDRVFFIADGVDEQRDLLMGRCIKK